MNTPSRISPMKYKNARDILPDDLFKELQQYISGGFLYVPSSEEKKSWGQNTGAREYYRQRNKTIREKHRNGTSIEELAEEYALSAETIRKILY